MSLYDLMGNSSTLPTSCLPVIPAANLPASANRNSFFASGSYTWPASQLPTGGNPAFSIVSSNKIPPTGSPITFTLPSLYTPFNAWRIKVTMAGYADLNGVPLQKWYFGFNISQGVNQVGGMLFNNAEPDLAIMNYDGAHFWLTGQFEDYILLPTIQGTAIDITQPVILNVYISQSKDAGTTFVNACNFNVTMAIDAINF